jgi:tetratricopeptide (TPR) repeat protein
MLANDGQIDLAKEILAREIAAAPHPILERLEASLNAGEIPPLPVASPAEGAAEVLYSLGSAIGADAEELATIYLSLSLFADPDNDYTAFALAELMQSRQRYEPSAEAFGAIPETSPFHAAAQVRRGLSLDAMDETEIAVNELKALIEAYPQDATASVTLADILSGRERFGEATEYYTKAIDLLETPETANWVLFYRRGITYERTDRWDLGEADFFRALELFPDRPEVLNYLGYTWADKGLNLDRALGMIQKAVDLRPNDGYIVDSLGWAHYMLGDYEEAVTHLERAVQLSPEDAVLNDHLGDAYWKVGRRREAVFQWTHARDLGAEGEALALIVNKIANGLPADEIKVPG